MFKELKKKDVNWKNKKILAQFICVLTIYWPNGKFINSIGKIKGYILNKIPLLSKLNFNLVAGAKLAASEDFKPYNEFSLGLDNIGFGKYRFLRVDYVRSYQSGFLNDAVMFGISF